MLTLVTGKLFVDKLFFPEEYNQGKELERTCEEDVSLNKCEGTCVSGIKPSAIDRSGFSKVSERI